MAREAGVGALTDELVGAVVGVVRPVRPMPAERAGYAMRDLSQLIGTCAGHGRNIRIHAERLLHDPLPWTRMRGVYRLIGLVRRYGPGPVETACSRSLDLDVVSVTKIASMLEKATEQATPLLPATAGSPTSRFARNPAEYGLNSTIPFTVIPGGATATSQELETTTTNTITAAMESGPIDPIGTA